MLAVRLHHVVRSPSVHLSFDKRSKMARIKPMRAGTPKYDARDAHAKRDLWKPTDAAATMAHRITGTAVNIRATNRSRGASSICPAKAATRWRAKTQRKRAVQTTAMTPQICPTRWRALLGCAEIAVLILFERTPVMREPPVGPGNGLMA